jgi:hypothetical protein
MAKRFTETNIWKSQKWFKRLSPLNKLFWKYLTDSCDHAGVWKIDYLALTEDLGVDTFSIQDFVTECNQDFDKLTGLPLLKERILVHDNQIIWITGFIQFQYQNKESCINPKVPVVKSSLDILKGYGMYQQALDKGYIRLIKDLDKGSGTLKDKDKDKDKDCIRVLEENKDSNGICQEMLFEFKQVNPAYQHDDDDLRKLLEIAYKVAAMQKWPKQSVVEEKRPDVVRTWKQIIQAIRGDPYYSAKDIAFLNRDWKSLILKISKPAPPKKTMQV